MSFAPIIPQSGLTGWAFLQRTGTDQREVLANTTQNIRETEYFRENIAKIGSAKELVDDRTLLKVALGAFGLEDDLSNKFYIQKVLEEGFATDDAFANRLADKSYLAFTKAMDLPLTGGNGVTSEEAIDNLVTAYEERSFEIAVGEVDPDMRLALSLDRDLSVIATRDVSNDTKWFTIMGSPPLRKVFETAFNLPTGFGTLPLDKQLETLQSRAESQLGTSDISDFSDPDRIEDLRRKFFLMSSINQLPTGQVGSVALTLLQSSNFSFQQPG